MQEREEPGDDFKLSNYHFELPRESIAQQPAVERTGSRLLTLHCDNRPLEHRQFVDLALLLAPGDLLVINNSRVFPARLRGQRDSGGQAEMLLLHYPQVRTCALGQQDPSWMQADGLALVRSSKRPKPGSFLLFGEELRAEIVSLQDEGQVQVRLHWRAGQGRTLDSVLESRGEFPLPPYIRRSGELPEDRLRYQTSYAARTGSVAAPTAGLHFSQDLLATIRGKGVRVAAVTLHVGYGTFAPVRCQDIREHVIHREFVAVPEETARLINQTRERGGRIWAVGTTSARSIEFACGADNRVHAIEGECGLYILPGYRFRVVDNLITNFHLPESSLLFLVAALAGRERILTAYAEAIALGYRFFSYGDAMAIVCKGE